MPEMKHALKTLQAAAAKAAAVAEKMRATAVHFATRVEAAKVAAAATLRMERTKRDLAMVLSGQLPLRDRLGAKPPPALTLASQSASRSATPSLPHRRCQAAAATPPLPGCCCQTAARKGMLHITLRSLRSAHKAEPAVTAASYRCQLPLPCACLCVTGAKLADKGTKSTVNEIVSQWGAAGDGEVCLLCFPPSNSTCFHPTSLCSRRHFVLRTPLPFASPPFLIKRLPPQPSPLLTPITASLHLLRPLPPPLPPSLSYHLRSSD